MTFKVENDLLNSIEKGESLVDSFSATIASELKERTNFSNPFYKKDTNPQGSKLISSVIAIALVLMIFLAGPATAFGVSWIINNNSSSAINTGDYVSLSADVSKNTTEFYSDRNVILNLTAPSFDQNYYNPTCNWDSQTYGYGYGYGYGNATLLNCDFIAGPLTQPGTYTGKIFIDGIAILENVSFEVSGTAVTPFDGNYGSTFTYDSIADEYTASSDVSVSVFENGISVSVLIPTGTEITSNTPGFDLNLLQVSNPSNSSLSEIGAFDNGTVYETIQFGVPRVTLYFSSPVEVRIPVSAANETVLQVKRKGFDGIWTTNGLTDSFTATCASGIATPANSSYTVTNGYIYVYTCQASDFTAYLQGTQVTGGGRTVTPVATTSQEPQEETVQPVDEAGPSMDDLVYETPSAPQDLDVDTVEQTSTPTGLFGFMGVGESELVPIILLVLAVGIIGFYFFKKRKK